MIARLANASDESRLREFRCSRGPHYEESVEDWIRGSAWRWYTTGSQEEDRRLLVIDDQETDELLAVGAHEQGEADWERFVNIIAVSLDRRRDVTGNGPRLGATMLATVIADATERSPGGVATWLVDVENRNSIIMCEKAGADWISAPGEAGYLRYRLDLEC